MNPKFIEIKLLLEKEDFELKLKLINICFQLKGLKSELSENKRLSSQTISLRDIKIVEIEGMLKNIQDDMGDNYNALRSRECEIKDLQRKVSESSEKLNAGELLRRKLHNKIQELKGNIRVYCRVRPFLDSEVWILSG